jgi:hypothetical protein
VTIPAIHLDISHLDPSDKRRASRIGHELAFDVCLEPIRDVTEVGNEIVKRRLGRTGLLSRRQILTNLAGDRDRRMRYDSRGVEVRMRITVDVPEGVFRTPKTPEQVAGDLRRAGAIFWLACGDVAPEAVAAITELAAPPGPEGTLMDLLLSMPDVGDDAVFERA